MRVLWSSGNVAEVSLSNRRRVQPQPQPHAHGPPHRPAPVYMSGSIDVETHAAARLAGLLPTTTIYRQGKSPKKMVRCLCSHGAEKDAIMDPKLHGSPG